jgi:hypothetical protein
MSYTQLIKELSSDDFDTVYEPSKRYLLAGNIGYGVLMVNELGVSTGDRLTGLNIKDAIKERFYELLQKETTFETRESGTDTLLGVQTGILDDDGILHLELSFFGPDSQGRMNWIYDPELWRETEESLHQLGIQKVYSYPAGRNMERFVKSMGCVFVKHLDNGNNVYQTPMSVD